MITVRVFRTGGGPQAHKKVKVHSGAGVSENYTDVNGTAHFERLPRGKYGVYVDGQRVYYGPIVDVQVVYIK